MNTRKKILIVDDDQTNREFFEVMLSKLGFSVAMADNGLTALDEVKRFHPDLVMLDNIMPKMSGWDVTKTLKSDPRYRDIAIIMFSALNNVKDKVEGFDLGVDDYITKPFNFSEVLARIKAVLRNKELLSQIAVREERLNMAEELSANIRNMVGSFVETVDELDKAIETSASADILREKSGAVRRNIAELDARIEKTMSEWKDLKKNELTLETLRTKIHTSMEEGGLGEDARSN